MKGGDYTRKPLVLYITAPSNKEVATIVMQLIGMVNYQIK